MKNYKKQEDSKNSILDEPVAGYATSSYYQLSTRGITKNYIKQVLLLAQLNVADLINFLPISIDTYKRKK